MKINSATFVKGIIGTDNILFDGKFQVAFMGRSNVGKSTLINTLLKRNGLARSSAAPGKTIRMDFFLINESFYFVDFRGYGYARRSSEKKERLAKMILWYLMYAEVENRLVIIVIDAKVGITAFDADILKTLEEHHINHIIVPNKIDKLKMGQKEKQLMKIRSGNQNSEIIPYSSKQHFRVDVLMKRISYYYFASGHGFEP